MAMSLLIKRISNKYRYQCYSMNANNKISDTTLSVSFAQITTACIYLTGQLNLSAGGVRERMILFDDYLLGLYFLANSDVNWTFGML